MVEMSTSDIKELIETLLKVPEGKKDSDVASIKSAHDALMVSWRSLLGQAVVDYHSYSSELNQLGKEIDTHFFNASIELRVRELSMYWIHCHRGLQALSQALSMIDRLENPPADLAIPKEEYDRVVSENESQKQVIKILSESRGYPELRELTRLSQSCGIQVDENWVLAVCAVNLIEAAVSKKLEDLKESTEGSFSDKLRRLAVAVKRSEGRDIQQLLPTALYEKIRNRLDHASHKYQVAEVEADNVYKSVASFLEELFPLGPNRISNLK